jgi:hypothetical protein
MIQMNEFIGSVVRLSASNRRNTFCCCVSCGVTYESNSTFVKSKYSYLQYHWCPVAFCIRAGL